MLLNLSKFIFLIFPIVLCYNLTEQNKNLVKTVIVSVNFLLVQLNILLFEFDVYIYFSVLISAVSTWNESTYQTILF